MTVALLLLLAASPLTPLEPLVGKQWVASAVLPDGQEMRSRTMWSWGRGKRCVRMRQFVLGKQGEVQRYETILYTDSATKRIVYRVFAGAGELSRGTVEFPKDGVLLEQPARDSFPAMRTLYAVRDDGICTTRISFRGAKGWTERVVTKSRRMALTPAKKLKLDGGVNPLAPIAKLTEANGWSWSLHERLLHGHLPDDGEVFVSFNARSGEILFVEIPADGEIREGSVTVVGKQRLEFAVAGKWRRVVTLADKGAHATWTERKDGDTWKRVEPAEKK